MVFIISISMISIIIAFISTHLLLKLAVVVLSLLHLSFFVHLFNFYYNFFHDKDYCNHYHYHY